MSETKTDSRNETPDERADRNWSDLLQELRVSQIGVQLLAASLVTLPFQAKFAELDTFQQRWYLAMLALALLTVGVTLAPVAIHRRLFRGGAKPQMVSAAHRLTGIALALVAILLAGISFFIVDIVVSRGAAAAAGAGALTIGLVLLVGIPRMVAHSADKSDDDQST